MSEFDYLFSTPESRMQLAERLNFVKTARSIFGVAGARLAWATVGLPEILHHTGDAAKVFGFLSACTIREDGARVQASVLYERYVAWVADGEVAMGQKAFARAIEANGHARVKASSMFFVGLRVKGGDSER